MSGGTVFILFWLHLEPVSYSKLQVIVSVQSCSLAGDVAKQTLKLFILHLALFYYLPIIIVDQNVSFHGQIGRDIG